MKIKSKYMMATKAIHHLGDISSSEPDMCVVHEETDTDYIGNWVYGFGFINVKFPKSTTYDLNSNEIEKYDGAGLSINGASIGKIDIK